MKRFRDPEEPKTEGLYLKVSRSERKLLERVAAHRGESYSQTVRSLLREEAARHSKSKGPPG
jgi:uncharacterized protein (DUF1778 family)